MKRQFVFLPTALFHTSDGCRGAYRELLFDRKRQTTIPFPFVFRLFEANRIKGPIFEWRGNNSAGGGRREGHVISGRLRIANVPLTLYIHANAEYFRAWSRVVPGVRGVPAGFISSCRSNWRNGEHEFPRSSTNFDPIAIARVYARDSILNTLAFRPKKNGRVSSRSGFTANDRR